MRRLPLETTDATSALPAGAEPRRRAGVWLALAASTLTLQLAAYLESGPMCLLPGQEFCYAFEVLGAVSKRKFWAVNLRDSLGPWVAAAFLGAVLDHRGRFQEHSALHVWTRRLAALALLHEFLWVIADRVQCFEDNGWDPSLASIAARDVLQVVFFMRVVMSYGIIVLRLRQLGHATLARAACWSLVVFAGLAVVAIALFRICCILDARVEFSVLGRIIAFGPVCLLAATSLLASAVFSLIAVWGMQATLFEANARLPECLASELAAAQHTIEWARLLVIVTRVSCVAMLLQGVMMGIAILPNICLPTLVVLLMNVVYLLAWASNSAQVILLSRPLGPWASASRRASVDSSAEMVEIGGFSRTQARHIATDEYVGSSLLLRPPSLGSRPPTPEPKRRKALWLVAGAAWISFQCVAYFVSGSECALAFGSTHTIRKNMFWAVSLSNTLGPWATAAILVLVLDHRGRFREDFPLHIWARRWAVCHPFCDMTQIVADTLNCFERRHEVFAILDDVEALILLFATLTLCWMIVLKFHDLGLLGMARLCYWLLSLQAWMRGASLLAFRTEYFLPPSLKRRIRIDLLGLVCYLLALLVHGAFLVISVRGLHTAAAAAEERLPDRVDDGFAAAKRAVSWARLTTIVTALSGFFRLLHGIALIVVVDGSQVGLLQNLVFSNVMYVMWHALECVQVALLSALVGGSVIRQSSEAAFVQVGKLGGYALQDVRRITFEGHVSALSQVCIVSFPGIYAELWDQVTRLQRRQASVACVLLPSVSSGLGLHAPDPENPQNACYCSAIYPPFQASNYMRVLSKLQNVDESYEEYQERLDFERADAAAQGICLLVEADHYACLWSRAKRKGTQKAQKLCQLNGCRAPWGCVWFARWVENVERAVRLGQKLMVFYHKDKVGAGKLDWEQLSDVSAVAAASARSGLGASQRVEVAYLDRRGYDYIEVDVDGFMEQFVLGGGRAMTM